jgi:hypothetical protein
MWCSVPCLSILVKCLQAGGALVRSGYLVPFFLRRSRFGLRRLDAALVNQSNLRVENWATEILHGNYLTVFPCFDDQSGVKPPQSKKHQRKSLLNSQALMRTIGAHT